MRCTIGLYLQFVSSRERKTNQNPNRNTDVEPEPSRLVDFEPVRRGGVRPPSGRRVTTHCPIGRQPYGPRHWLVGSFVHSSIRSFLHSSIHPFIHSFICSLLLSQACGCCEMKLPSTMLAYATDHSLACVRACVRVCVRIVSTLPRAVTVVVVVSVCVSACVCVVCACACACVWWKVRVCLYSSPCLSIFRLA